jgi:hypothetical protein
MIIKRWNLQTILVNNEPINEPYPYHLIPNYSYYTFFYANSLDVNSYIDGRWEPSADGYYSFVNKSTVEMRFTIIDQRYNISAKIKKLTKRELHLEYENKGNTYYLKLYGN